MELYVDRAGTTSGAVMVFVEAEGFLAYIREVDRCALRAKAHPLCHVSTSAAS